MNLLFSFIQYHPLPLDLHHTHTNNFPFHSPPVSFHPILPVLFTPFSLVSHPSAPGISTRSLHLDPSTSGPLSFAHHSHNLFLTPLVLCTLLKHSPTSPSLTESCQGTATIQRSCTDCTAELHRKGIHEGWRRTRWWGLGEWVDGRSCVRCRVHWTRTRTFLGFQCRSFGFLIQRWWGLGSGCVGIDEMRMRWDATWM